MRAAMLLTLSLYKALRSWFLNRIHTTRPIAYVTSVSAISKFVQIVIRQGAMLIRHSNVKSM